MSDLEKARKYLKFGKIVQAEGLLMSVLESAKAEKDTEQQETILDLMIGHLYAPSQEYAVARGYLEQLRALNGDPERLRRNEALVESIKISEQKPLIKPASGHADGTATIRTGNWLFLISGMRERLLGNEALHAVSCRPPS